MFPGIDRILSTKSETPSPTPPPAHTGYTASANRLKSPDGRRDDKSAILRPEVSDQSDARTVDINGLDLPDGTENLLIDNKI